MECGGCPLTVRTSLQRLRGVRVVAVDTSARTITVAVSDERVTDRQLTMATANAGYPSSVVRKATATSSKASR